jgi:hypothetical protein
MKLIIFRPDGLISCQDGALVKGFDRENKPVRRVRPDYYCLARLLLLGPITTAWPDYYCLECCMVAKFWKIASTGKESSICPDPVDSTSKFAAFTCCGWRERDLSLGMLPDFQSKPGQIFPLSWDLTPKDNVPLWLPMLKRSCPGTPHLNIESPLAGAVHDIHSGLELFRVALTSTYGLQWAESHNPYGITPAVQVGFSHQGQEKA